MKFTWPQLVMIVMMLEMKIMSVAPKPRVLEHYRPCTEAL